LVIANILFDKINKDKRKKRKKNQNLYQFSAPPKYRVGKIINTPLHSKAFHDFFHIPHINNKNEVITKIQKMRPANRNSFVLPLLLRYSGRIYKFLLQFQEQKRKLCGQSLHSNSD